MKCLTLFVHAAIAEAVTDTLLADPDVPGFTLTPCQGHSPLSAETPLVEAQDLVRGHLPRVRIEIVLPDAQVPSLLERLRRPLSDSATASGASLGTWMITPVDDFGRL